MFDRFLGSTIDFTFRNPLALKVILQVDDSRVFTLLSERLPVRLIPFRRALFTRAFAHFIGSEEIALLTARRSGRNGPERASTPLPAQPDLR